MPAEYAIQEDEGLVAKSQAAHHAITAPFAKPVDFSAEPLVVQYEVKYQKGGNCGGGYIKLLEDGFFASGKEFDDQAPWVVMFGPDLTCPGTKVCPILLVETWQKLIFAASSSTLFSDTKTLSQVSMRRSILPPRHVLPLRTRLVSTLSLSS